MAVVLLKQITLKQAYDAIEWPVIVMLGCLIPVGEGLKDTGATTRVGQALTHVAQLVTGYAAVAPWPRESQYSPTSSGDIDMNESVGALRLLSVGNRRQDTYLLRRVAAHRPATRRGISFASRLF
mgnify:FL=1